MSSHRLRHRKNFIRRKKTTRRIVGIDDDGKSVRCLKIIGVSDSIDGNAGGSQNACILPIGWSEDGCPLPRIRDPRKQLNDRLRSRHRQGHQPAGPVIAAGRRARCLFHMPVRQPMPGPGIDLRQRRGTGIDARREVKPVLRPAAEARCSFRDSAAMGDRIGHGHCERSMRCMKDPATFRRLSPARPRSTPAASLTAKRGSAVPSETIVA